MRACYVKKDCSFPSYCLILFEVYAIYSLTSLSFQLSSNQLDVREAAEHIIRSYNYPSFSVHTHLSLTASLSLSCQLLFHNMLLLLLLFVQCVAQCCVVYN